jgi:hypothetical protein
MRIQKMFFSKVKNFFDQRAEQQTTRKNSRSQFLLSGRCFAIDPLIGVVAAVEVAVEVEVVMARSKNPDI